MNNLCPSSLMVSDGFGQDRLADRKHLC